MKKTLTTLDGENSFIWDGLDEAGRSVPPEVYRYTLALVNETGKKIEWDVSDHTGGMKIEAQDIVWDNERNLIQYVLPKAARVSVRIGLNSNGPLLKNIHNWVPRQSGLNAEQWDGYDKSGVLDLSEHPQRYIRVLAYKLSDNSIFVGKKSDKVELIKGLPWGLIKRDKKKLDKKRMYQHSQQPIESRRNINVNLVLPDGLQYSSTDVAVVNGIVPVRLEVKKEDRELAVNRRHEPVFYVDGQYVFENEVGFFPMTWKFNTETVSEGIHYITVNLLGYEGNFGIETIKVMVQH